MLAALDDLSRDRDARGAQQLLQLGQLVAPGLASSLREHGDAQRALAGARVDDPCTASSRVLRLPRAPVPFGLRHPGGV
jgi:hypothetical protein